MNRAWLLLGGNLGDRIYNLEEAKIIIQKKAGNIIKFSSIYETAAWGNINQPAFLNQVIIVETTLTAEETMNEILSIENKLGRIRTQKNAARTIDIDILFYNDDVIKTKNLSIPHPEIQNRNFVLYPLNEISPELLHPVLKKTIHELLLSCNDTLHVQLFQPDRN